MGLLEKILGKEMVEELKKKDKPQIEGLNFEAKIKSELEKDKKREATLGGIIFWGIAMIVMVTLLYWLVYCPLVGCNFKASSGYRLPSTYDCQRDPLSPECQDIYYDNPLH